jgi:uncharacterized protein YbjT (DUF2867 family)
MSILIVGGTGTLGRQIVKESLLEGHQVKCLVRNFRRATSLKVLGAELVYGDLSIPSTILPSLEGVETLIDCATSFNSTEVPRGTFETVDWRGKIALLEAAKLGGIKKFIYFSILHASLNPSIRLMLLKLNIEKKLKVSGLNYTIFLCSGFFQGLISEYALPILENETIFLPKNSTPIAYVDGIDVARAVVQVLEKTSCPSSEGFAKYYKKTLALLGPEEFSPEEVATLFSLMSGVTPKKISRTTSNNSIRPIAQFLSFFKYTWSIADRLQFGGIVANLPKNEVACMDWSFERRSLASYLEEFLTELSGTLDMTLGKTIFDKN